MKNVGLEAAAKEAEKLLAQISESTTIAEKEKAKVAVIVDAVTAKAQACSSPQCCSGLSWPVRQVVESSAAVRCAPCQAACLHLHRNTCGLRAP